MVMFPKYSPGEKAVTCPICKMEVNERDAVKKVYRGEILYFCSRGCTQEYEKRSLENRKIDVGPRVEPENLGELPQEISMIHYSAPSKVAGGVEIVIEYHAKALADRGVKVHLIYGEGGGLNHEGIIEHIIPLLSANNHEITKLQTSLLNRSGIEQLERIKGRIKKSLIKEVPEGPCIVHNLPSMPFNFAATAAINELADKRNNFIFWLHDSILLREGWQDKLGKFPYTLLHHKNDNLIFVTPTSYRAKQFAGLPPPYDIPNMFVIPNGISIDEYIKIDEITKLLMKKLGLTFSNHIIVLPVRVTPRKNIELALYVVGELKKMLPPEMAVKLLITGPPDHQTRKKGIKYMAYLQQIIRERGIEENVIFCPEVINRFRRYKNGEIVKWSVADIYNIADLIFIPSREEGFGLPVIEAGASRKPLFCSRIPPFKELFREGLEGDMFDLDDPPNDIADRIYKLWLNDKVDNNFENVVQRFSWDSIVQKKLIPLLIRYARAIRELNRNTW